MSDSEHAAVSFDLFGTLVTVDRLDDPAEEIAVELEARGVGVPDDWNQAFTTSHTTVPPGQERSLVEHVEAALHSRTETCAKTSTHHETDMQYSRKGIEQAVLAAFETDVQTVSGAVELVEMLGEQLPVGVLSNCSVPSLAERVLVASELDIDVFDVVVTSVGCGWRKPHPRAFEEIARELGTPLETVVHIGDDPAGEKARFTGSATPVGDAERACVREAVRASLASRYADKALSHVIDDAEYGAVTDRRAEVFTLETHS